MEEDRASIRAGPLRNFGEAIGLMVGARVSDDHRGRKHAHARRALGQAKLTGADSWTNSGVLQGRRVSRAHR
jgi:hypothetical protein